MLIPELLFKLSRPKDAAQQQIAVVDRFVVGPDSPSPGISATVYENTSDEVVVLSNAVAYTDSDSLTLHVDTLSIYKASATPGAPQQVIAFQANSRPNAAQPFPDVGRYQQSTLNWTGQVWVMPGELVAVSTFSEDAGGVTEHRVLGYIHGIRIPRANITSG